MHHTDCSCDLFIFQRIREFLIFQSLQIVAELITLHIVLRKDESVIGVVLQVDIDLDLILVLQRVELLLHQLQIPVRAAQFLLRLLLHVLLLVRFYLRLGFESVGILVFLELLQVLC